MHKAEMIDKISSRTGLSKRRAERVLECLLGEITESLSRGEPVRFMGFGTFDAVTRSPRTGRNVTSGEQVEIPSRVVPVFRPGRFLKAAVQNRR